MRRSCPGRYASPSLQRSGTGRTGSRVAQFGLIKHHGTEAIETLIPLTNDFLEQSADWPKEAKGVDQSCFGTDADIGPLVESTKEGRRTLVAVGGPVSAET